MAEVTFVPNHVPAPACYPPDFNAMLDELTTGGGLSGTVPDNAGGGVFVGSSPPSSALTNKVWFKTDAAGRPLGVFMWYNGNWRKVYTGAALGEIRMLWYYSGFFDGTGRGTIGGDYDGWALCNGQNGTPNLEGYFPAPGATGEAVGGAAGTWYSNADGLGYKNSGGQRARVVLNMRNLPLMQAVTHIMAIAPAPTGNLVAVATNDPAQPLYDLPVQDVNGQGGASVALPFQNLYIAMGFMMFVGYL